MAIPADGLRLKRVQIIDRNGFEKPLLARTLLVPHDWSTAGGIEWQAGQQTDCGATTPYTNFAAFSADGHSGVALLPAWKFFGTSLPLPQVYPCKNILNQTPRGLFSEYIQKLRPGARELDYRPRPQIQAFLQQLTPPMMPMPGVQQQHLMEVGQYLIGYQENGIELRESIIFMGTTTNIIFEPDLFTGQRMQMSSGFVLPSFSARAPDGQLNFQQMEQLMGTLQDDPAYSKRMAEHYRKLAEARRPRPSPSSPTPSDSGPSVADIQMAGWKSRNKRTDRGQRESTEASAPANSAIGSMSLCSPSNTLFDNCTVIQDR